MSARQSAILLGVLVSCSQPSIEQQILGTWESNDAKLALTYRFDKGGKWSSQQALPKVNHTTTGSWKLEGLSVVISPEASTLLFDGKPKPSPVGRTERDEIVTLTGSALVLKTGVKDGQDELARFHRVRGN